MTHKLENRAVNKWEYKKCQNRVIVLDIHGI